MTENLTCQISIIVSTKIHLGKGYRLVDGKSKPKMENTDSDCVKEAEEACPVDAIKIEEV